MNYDVVDCPYCDHENNVSPDCYCEGENEFDMECSNCSKEFKVSVDYSPNFTSTQILYNYCKECNKRYRYEGKRSPRPIKYKSLPSEEYEICDSCYYQLVANEIKFKKED